ncbi:MAG TPA: hypothetical protein VL418_13030 [Devosiaceae bacterium]|nr:hypothetical protein [Devosiaceae bacterium]
MRQEYLWLNEWASVEPLGKAPNPQVLLLALVIFAAALTCAALSHQL